MNLRYQNQCSVVSNALPNARTRPGRVSMRREAAGLLIESKLGSRARQVNARAPD
jgi:hypothetical protein